MADNDSKIIAYPITVQETAESFFTNLMLMLLKQRRDSGCWGHSTVDITWKEGWPTLAEITDRVTYKFPDPKEPKSAKSNK